MRILIQQIFFLCFLTTLSFSQTEQIFTDSKKIKPLKIKSIVVWGRSYDYGVASEDSNMTSVLKFDTSGNLLEIVTHYLTNTEDSIWESSTRQFKYDTLGRRIETTMFDSENFPGYTFEKIQYSESFVSLFSFTYSRWGDTNEKQLLKYDLKKNIIHEERYYNDGTISLEATYFNEYDSIGKIISIINFMDSTNEVCFYYDSCGSRLEQTEYWHDTIFSQYFWKYDSLFFLKEEKKQIKFYNVNERTIFYWDTIGNKVREDYCDLRNSDTCLMRKSFAYDSLRKKIEEAVYDSGRIVVKKTNWAYDDCGVLREKKIFSPAEIGQGELAIYFDEEGNILEERKTSAAKKLQYKISYRYNEKQMPELIIHLDGQKKPLGHIRYVYEHF